MRRLAVLAVLLAAAPAAAASGPSPGVLQGGDGVVLGDVGYSTVAGGGRTTLSVSRDAEPVRSAKLPGAWGVPLVSFRSQAGGLSHDGRTLVLAQATLPRGVLRAVSRFLVLDTRTLAVTHRLRLAGDFSYDALSPDGSTLFLVQHTSSVQLTHYRVRAYDLRRSRLLRRVVADKRQASWVMDGLPMTRATSPDGRWEYTLYAQQDNYPFVHALDTVSKTAVCVGIPWRWTQDMNPTDMSLKKGKLVIRIGLGPRTYVLDTRTLRLLRY